MKGYLALLIMVVGTSVSGALFADWLQDLSRQAEENLRLQGQRAIGGVPPAPLPKVAEVGAAKGPVHGMAVRVMAPVPAALPGFRTGRSFVGQRD